MIELPKSECEYGYTRSQVEEIVGDKKDDFNQWMYGQTMTLCPQHGIIAYASDVYRYVANLPVID